jgi:hypothetical protein
MRQSRRAPIVATLAAIAISGAAVAAGLSLPEALAGVYKTRFNNGLVTGEKFVSEDILEIVPTAPAAAYVRLHLEFYNGHECALSGIVHVEGPDLVYREPPADKAGDRVCVLHVSRKSGKVALSDEGGSCQAYCGARGSLSNDSVPLSSRRTIRYMARLKASSEFKEALAEDAKRGR